MTVPQYRHDVALDYTRVELAVAYTVRASWDVIARLPWEQKVQNAHPSFLGSLSEDDRSAMQRNIDLHHRSATLRGVSDFMLLSRHRSSRLDRGALSLSAGLTLPTGHTVENPYRQGDRGIQHLHIQFGTGTFDPLFEAAYRTPLRGPFHAGAYLTSRLPLYQNSRGFQAPSDGTLGIHLSHRTTDRLQFRVEGAGYTQGYGYWNDVRDENTGLIATSVALGGAFRRGDLVVSADVRYPISQRTLAEGDAFEQGSTFVISFGGPLR